MRKRSLGRSGIKITEISMGCGPISGLWVGSDGVAQNQTFKSAVDSGINWFDTAATYGEGRSEEALGAALSGCQSPESCQVATKVRLTPDQMGEIGSAIRHSVQQSLRRLKRQRVTLLQLHNSVTRCRGDLPTSLTVEDVFGAGGVIQEFERLKAEGTVEALGFTGLGDWESLSELVASRVFDAVQIPLNLLTPFAGQDASAGSVDVDYLQLTELCAEHEVGVIAIRLFAGGALTGQAPSSHTFKTKFFTLDVYRRDAYRAERIASELPDEISIHEATIRYVLGLPGVSTALVGFASPSQIDQAVAFSSRGPLPEELQRAIVEIGENVSPK